MATGSREVESRGQKVSHEAFYLNVLPHHVRNGHMGSLDNAMLHELGAGLELFPGVANFFKCSKARVRDSGAYRTFDIKLKHYIVSTSLTGMIKGPPTVPHINDTWGREFLEASDMSADGRPVVSEVICAIDSTTKARALFGINKGANKHLEAASVSSSITEDKRHVPSTNMIYVADGPGDTLAFPITHKDGGHTYTVYGPEDPRSFE